METPAYIFSHLWPGQEEELGTLNRAEWVVSALLESLERIDPNNKLLEVVKFVGEFNKIYLEERTTVTLNEHIAALRKYGDDLKAEIHRILKIVPV